MRLKKRFLYALLPTLFFLIGLEVLLRIWYPTLPSLAGAGNFEKAASFEGSNVGCDFIFGSRPRRGSGGILFLGDSVTGGFGVGPEESFPALLQAAFPERKLEQRAREGADFCMELIELDRRLQRPDPPSLVVWEVFSDDLMSYMLYSHSGVPVGVFEAEPEPLSRWLAGHSYLFNWGWFRLRLHQGGASGRMVSPQQRSLMLARLHQMQLLLSAANIRLLPFLLEPAGWPDCPERSDPQSACGWMQVDLEVLAGILRSAGLKPLDLRGFWSGQPSRVIFLEQRAQHSGQIGIHPDAEGHRRLAEALRPAIEKYLSDMEK